VRAAALLAAVALLAAACGAEEEPSPSRAEPQRLSFEDARAAEDGTSVELVGAVYADGEPMRVCRALAESFPPQCGGGIPVVGVSWDELPRVQRASGVTWTDAAVALVGDMVGGTLHVELVRDAPSGPPTAEPPAPPPADGDEPVGSYR
jgi:hypothetical protein